MIIILFIWVWSQILDWVSGSLQVWSGYTEYTGGSEKSIRERMRWSAWWKRFILGWDLITCIQSSLQCPQPGSADAVCCFFFFSLVFHNFFSISSTCLLWWCWDKILGPEPLKWFIAIETWYNFALRPEIKRWRKRKIQSYIRESPQPVITPNYWPNAGFRSSRWLFTTRPKNKWNVPLIMCTLDKWCH